MADDDEAKIRADAAARRARGVARVSRRDEVTGRLYPKVEQARPVFVDDSGRRGRWLTLLSVGVAVIGLALVAAVWWSQASVASG
ncbi:hypothetical protein [Mangrovihabitans endophyticus]|uniref:Uncharacterized protein n=1 Tax=Mangrovihabitans endophyticus TaxID=1751298 RepID=A0A8J3FKA9_9ACTN|nr:hypothetical protein [Mangrovihabitans endophyticus]GGK72085.1 hypothetical protein GCM10012284_02360 [Mangrovihabitans endophyticus]